MVTKYVHPNQNNAKSKQLDVRAWWVGVISLTKSYWCAAAAIAGFRRRLYHHLLYSLFFSSFFSSPLFPSYQSLPGIAYTRLRLSRTRTLPQTKRAHVASARIYTHRSVLLLLVCCADVFVFIHFVHDATGTTVLNSGTATFTEKDDLRRSPLARCSARVLCKLDPVEWVQYASSPYPTHFDLCISQSYSISHSVPSQGSAEAWRSDRRVLCWRFHYSNKG